MALPFAGRHCAIVGATGTIGFSIAKSFASHGAVLSLLGRTAVDARPKLEPLLTPYQPPPNARADRPSAHRFIAVDARSQAGLKSAFAPEDSSLESDAVVGSVDILINCAGISQNQLHRSSSYSDMKNVLDTNLTATMLACKYAKIQKRGCIINVSSLMATKPAAGAAAYAAAKAGVIGFTTALCLEMAPRAVRVNALLPGWVESPMWETLEPKLKDKYLKNTPLRRVATADEVADAAVFLASNGYANNCILNLDGGLSAA